MSETKTQPPQTRSFGPVLQGLQHRLELLVCSKNDQSNIFGNVVRWLAAGFQVGLDAKKKRRNEVINDCRESMAVSSEFALFVSMDGCGPSFIGSFEDQPHFQAGNGDKK